MAILERRKLQHASRGSVEGHQVDPRNEFDSCVSRRPSGLVPHMPFTSKGKSIAFPRLRRKTAADRHAQYDVHAGACYNGSFVIWRC